MLNGARSNCIEIINKGSPTIQGLQFPPSPPDTFFQVERDYMSLYGLLEKQMRKQGFQGNSINAEKLLFRASKSEADAKH